MCISVSPLCVYMCVHLLVRAIMTKYSANDYQVIQGVAVEYGSSSTPYSDRYRLTVSLHVILLLLSKGAKKETLQIIVRTPCTEKPCLLLSSFIFA